MGENEISSVGKVQKDASKKEKKEEIPNGNGGVASIALLPNGSISGHFIQLPHSICYGLHGTELECERECSRGEDYRLIKLTVTDYNTKREKISWWSAEDMMLPRYVALTMLMGLSFGNRWQKDVVGMLEQKHGKHKVSVLLNVKH
ncbi:UNVERIFIED_CONTAM: hypothetical protein Sangu_1270300 [Sesamum angustifolium]|uniref:Uncharacterized protein n=1 Tax=Sesamum angustifolium TaxID=2727405 RepID=A0AAW2NJR4_9LAMI